jgi:hypothetical protein
MVGLSWLVGYTAAALFALLFDLVSRKKQEFLF